MTRKIIVTGFLQTLSPLHIAAPSSARVDSETGQLSYDEKKTPCSTIQKMKLAVPIKVVRENVEDKIFTPSVPVIAANNLSGRIRRRVGTEFLNALSTKATPETVSISTYSAIMSGAATGNPDGTPVSYDEYKRAKEHVFLGLMGGGPRMMERRARTHNSLAYCTTSKDLLDDSRIPFDQIYQEGWFVTKQANFVELNASDLTQIWTYRRNDDLRDLVNISHASEQITDFVASYNERQAKIIEEKNQKGESKTSTFTFQALEFVQPGVSFPLVFVLDDISDEQAGLWFRGFDAFCKEERLGGLSRNGFGEFHIQHGRVAVFVDGELESSEDLADESGFRVKAIESWLNVAEKQEAAEIEWLMRLPPPKKDKKAKKEEATSEE